MGMDIKHLDDESLCMMACSGNPYAVEIIINRWEKQIYSLAKRMLANHEDAEDATQEIFLKLFTKMHTFNGDSSFKTWLYSVALNMIKDHRRSQMRRNTLINIKSSQDETEEMDRKDEKIPDPFEQTHKKQFQEKLKESLCKLPEKQRVILILKEYNDLTFEEISDIVNCPVSTVKSRLYKGLDTLKQILCAMN